MVLRVGNDAVVLLTAGIALELVQRDYLRQFFGLVVYTSEIAHGGCTGYVEAAADLFGGRDLFKGTDDLGYQNSGAGMCCPQRNACRSRNGSGAYEGAGTYFLPEEHP